MNTEHYYIPSVELASDYAELEKLRCQMGLNLYRAACRLGVENGEPNVTLARERVRSQKNRKKIRFDDAVDAFRRTARLARHIHLNKRPYQRRVGYSDPSAPIRHNPPRFAGYKTPFERTRLPLEGRWRMLKRADIKAVVKSGLGFYPSHGEFSVDLDKGLTNPVVRTWSEKIADKYSSRCTYPIIGHYASLRVPFGGRGISADITDGITMLLQKGESMSVGGVSATPGWILTKGAGYSSVRVTASWLVTHEASRLSAHGETREKAMSALRRKIAALKREHEPITPDTIVTPALFQKWTGACTQGTNEWLEAHGFDRTARGTVRDLLAIMEPGTYGRTKLESLIAAAM